MTRLIIIRHGETEANVQQVWQGSLDAPLTDRGRRQVAATAQEVARLHYAHAVEHFYVSPLPRAQSTAAAIAQAIHLEPAIAPALREFDLGDWEGRTFQDLRDTEDLWTRWDRDPGFAPPNGESPRLFGRRAVQGLRDLVERHPQATVLAVTHGGIICNALATWLGAGPQDWRNWEPHNCAISILEHASPDQAQEIWRPIRVNDIGHLPADAVVDEDQSVYAPDGDDD